MSEMFRKRISQRRERNAQLEIFSELSRIIALPSYFGYPRKKEGIYFDF